MQVSIKNNPGSIPEVVYCTRKADAAGECLSKLYLYRVYGKTDAGKRTILTTSRSPELKPNVDLALQRSHPGDKGWSRAPVVKNLGPITLPVWQLNATETMAIRAMIEGGIANAN